MSKGNKDLLKHIVGYCNQIDEAHAQFGNSYEAFCNNSVYRNAVAMCVLQIGELANHLTEEFREATAQDIPWKQIRGLRNVVAHEYGNIDEESLWETITDDIPVLCDFCTKQIELLNAKMKFLKEKCKTAK